jgi:hypothetical protein
MSFKLGGIILEDIVMLSTEEQIKLEKAGHPVPAPRAIITVHDKLILLALASFADKDGRRIYASRNTLARIAGGCSVRTVQFALDKFIDDGVLFYDERVDKHGTPIRGRTRRYRIDVARAVELYAAPLKEESHSYIAAGDDAANEESDSLVVTDSNDSGIRNEESDSLRSESDSYDVGIPFPESCQNPQKESLRPSPAGSAGDGQPAGDGPHDAASRDDTPKQNAWWKANAAAIRSAFLYRDFDQLVERLTVITDDGLHMVLGVGSRYHADEIALAPRLSGVTIKAKLEELLRRTIEVKVVPWCEAAYHERRARRLEADSAARRAASGTPGTTIRLAGGNA